MDIVENAYAIVDESEISAMTDLVTPERTMMLIQNRNGRRYG